MGLGYTPLFKIEANGNDVTEHIAKNLVSLSFDDNSGTLADELNITVFGNFKRPDYQDKLKLLLGYKETGLYFCGTFIIQNTSRDYKENRLSIAASSVDFNGTLKEKRNISYNSLSLSKLCGIIAERNKLQHKCDVAANIESISQTNESDLSFMERLSKKCGAIFSIKNDTLLFFKEKGDEFKFKLHVNECKALNIKYANRLIYNSVSASWHKTKENELEKVTVGKDTPEYHINRTFTDKEQARISCEAKLKKLSEGTKSGSLTTTGRNFFAGGILNIEGAGEDSGEYKIKKVTHNISASGYTINLEFENKGLIS